MLSDEQWCAVVCDGVIGRRINEALMDTRYFYDESTRVWKKLYYYPYLEDDEFEVLYPKLIHQLEAGDIENLGELKSIAGIILSLSDKGIVLDDSDSLLTKLVKATDKMVDEDRLPSMAIYSEYEFLHNEQAHESLGSQGESLDSYKEFTSYINKKSCLLYTSDAADE